MKKTIFIIFIIFSFFDGERAQTNKGINLQNIGGFLKYFEDIDAGSNIKGLDLG